MLFTTPAARGEGGATYWNFPNNNELLLLLMLLLLLLLVLLLLLLLLLLLGDDVPTATLAVSPPSAISHVRRLLGVFDPPILVGVKL